VGFEDGENEGVRYWSELWLELGLEKGRYVD
jgi:hypothetical protein